MNPVQKNENTTNSDSDFVLNKKINIGIVDDKICGSVVSENISRKKSIKVRMWIYIDGKIKNFYDFLKRYDAEECGKNLYLIDFSFFKKDDDLMINDDFVLNEFSAELDYYLVSKPIPSFFNNMLKYRCYVIFESFENKDEIIGSFIKGKRKKMSWKKDDMNSNFVKDRVIQKQKD